METKRLGIFQSDLPLLFAAPTLPEISCAPGFPGGAPIAGPWPLWRAERDVYIVTGPSAALSAGGLSWALTTGAPGHVCGFGIAGAYPGSGIAVGDVALVEWESFCDLGAQDGDQFLDFPELRLPELPSENIFPLTTGTIPDGPTDRGFAFHQCGGTTASTCTGSLRQAQERSRRTGASIESMEGAAWAMIARRFGAQLMEVRAVSNIASERRRQEWKIELALRNLRDWLHSGG